LWCVVAVLVLAPALLRAQALTNPGASSPASRYWLTVGGASTTLLGDCSDCEADTYLHTGNFMAAAGWSLTSRTDLGGEYLWVPATLTTGDHLKVSFLMATVQFRPWQSQGFFLKASSGMAFFRNWLKTIDENATAPLRSKAFAVGLGAGWEWRTRSRLGVQAYGTMHAAALGDLETSDRTIQNVMGNFWSVGGAIVIR
jgi:hypothetical protein